MPSLKITSKSIGIVPAISFSATANALHYLGIEVVFCDIDPSTGLMCTESLDKILNDLPNTKNPSGLIAPVSFAGALAPLPEVYDLARKKKILRSLKMRPIHLVLLKIFQWD